MYASSVAAPAEINLDAPSAEMSASVLRNLVWKAYAAIAIKNCPNVPFAICLLKKRINIAKVATSVRLAQKK